MKKSILTIALSLIGFAVCFAGSDQAPKKDGFVYVEYIDASSTDPTAADAIGWLRPNNTTWDDGHYGQTLAKSSIIPIGFAKIEEDLTIKMPGNWRDESCKDEVRSDIAIKDFKKKYPEVKILLSFGGATMNNDDWPNDSHPEDVAKALVKWWTDGGKEMFDGFDFDLESMSPFAPKNPEKSMEEFKKFIEAIKKDERAKDIILTVAPQPYMTSAKDIRLVIPESWGAFYFDEEILDLFDYVFVQLYGINGGGQDDLIRYQGHASEIDDFCKALDGLVKKEKLIIGKPAAKVTSGYNSPESLERNIESIKSNSGGIMIWSFAFDLAHKLEFINTLAERETELIHSKDVDDKN